MNPEIFRYNTALSAQLPCSASLFLYRYKVDLQPYLLFIKYPDKFNDKTRNDCEKKA